MLMPSFRSEQAVWPSLALRDPRSKSKATPQKPGPHQHQHHRLRNRSLRGNPPPLNRKLQSISHRHPPLQAHPSPPIRSVAMATAHPLPRAQQVPPASPASELPRVLTMAIQSMTLGRRHANRTHQRPSRTKTMPTAYYPPYFVSRLTRMSCRVATVPSSCFCPSSTRN